MKTHKWTGAEEQMIKKRYAERTWGGMRELAVELGVSYEILRGHIQAMKRKGRL